MPARARTARAAPARHPAGLDWYPIGRHCPRSRRVRVEQREVRRPPVTCSRRANGLALRVVWRHFIDCRQLSVLSRSVALHSLRSIFHLISPVPGHPRDLVDRDFTACPNALQAQTSPMCAPRRAGLKSFVLDARMIVACAGGRQHLPTSRWMRGRWRSGAVRRRVRTCRGWGPRRPRGPDWAQRVDTTPCSWSEASLLITNG